MLVKHRKDSRWRTYPAANGVIVDGTGSVN